MPKINELIKKYNQFFSDDTPGQILANICPYTFPMDYSAFGVPGRSLKSWDFDREMKTFVELGVRRHRAFIKYTEGLDNDYVPAISLGFGYGVHSAYFTGQEVIMGDDTSWTHPFMTSWDKLVELKQDENNYWFQKIIEAYGYLRDYCNGDFILSGFSNAGPGDMANAVRGDDLFYDIYDEPENVHALMDKCADAFIWLETEIKKITGYAEGGTVTANMWFPGDAPYLSEDFFDLCAPEVYEEFGFKHTQRILKHFGGAYIHHHAKGFHIHKKIAPLKHLKALELSLDPNCDRPIDRLPELFEMNCGVPLMIRCHACDVYEHIEELKKGRVIIMLNIDDLEQGREVMKFIRKNSII